jgi:hypothetical protein
MESLEHRFSQDRTGSVVGRAHCKARCRKGGVIMTTLVMDWMKNPKAPAIGFSSGWFSRTAGARPAQLSEHAIDWAGLFLF